MRGVLHFAKISKLPRPKQLSNVIMRSKNENVKTADMGENGLKERRRDIGWPMDHFNVNDPIA